MKFKHLESFKFWTINNLYHGFKLIQRGYRASLYLWASGVTSKLHTYYENIISFNKNMIDNKTFLAV